MILRERMNVLDLAIYLPWRKLLVAKNLRKVKTAVYSMHECTYIYVHTRNVRINMHKYACTCMYVHAHHTCVHTCAEKVCILSRSRLDLVVYGCCRSSPCTVQISYSNVCIHTCVCRVQNSSTQYTCRYISIHTQPCEGKKLSYQILNSLMPTTV